MSPEIVTIIALVVIFAIATVLPINMGALAFVAAFVVGTLSVGLTTDEILEGFPAELVLTLIGVTYLFAIAQNNGTVDLLVRGAVRLVGGHRRDPLDHVLRHRDAHRDRRALPRRRRDHRPDRAGVRRPARINPLLMGMMVIHGAQGGGFSPISVYGVTVNEIVGDEGLPDSSVAVFLGSLFFNLAIALVLFFVLGGASSWAARSRCRGRPRRRTPPGDGGRPEVKGHGAALAPAVGGGDGGDGRRTAPRRPEGHLRTDPDADRPGRARGPGARCSTSTSASSRSASPSSWPCSPRRSTRARSARSAGPPSCSSPAC